MAKNTSSNPDRLTLTLEALRLANAVEVKAEALVKTLEDLNKERAERVATACEMAWGYYVSQDNKRGVKAMLARESGVAEMTLGRWVASGRIASITAEAISANTVNSDLGNGLVTLTQLEKVTNAKEYRALVAKNKEQAKRERQTGKPQNGNKGKGKGKKDTAESVTVAPATLNDLVNGIVALVKSGTVTLEQVNDAWADAVATLSTVEELVEA